MVAGSALRGRNSVVRGILGRAGRAAVEPLENRVLFAAGVLDTTFNGTGTQVAKYRATNDGVAVALQSDGKIVVVGDTQATGGSQDAFVSRYNADGSVDTTFNGIGVTFLDLGSDDVATGVAVQGDGKIVVVGVTGQLSAQQGNFFVARYNADGTLDTTFNGTGTKTIDFGGADAASGVAITSQGRIIVVGASLSGLQSGIAMAFLNPDGSFDTSAGPGQVTESTGPGTFDAGTSIALAPSSGRFYVSGVSFNALGGGAKFMVSEFNPDGSPTTSFGNGGRAFASFGNGVELATGVAVDPTNNKIVAAGVSANGILDFAPGFPLPGSIPASRATQADFALARFNTDGTLDSSFGTGHGGTLININTPSGAANLDAASDVVVQSDGKVIASGGSEDTATGNSSFATVRVGTNGVLDNTFGNGGVVTTSFGAATSDGSFGMALQPDGKPVEVGHSKVNASNSSVAIVRYTGDTGTQPGPVPGLVPGINVTNVVVGKLPKTVVGGQSDAKGQVKVTLLNNTSASVKVPVQINLFGSTTQTANPSSDLKLGSAKPTVKLGPNKSTTVTVNAKFPTVPADENLFVVAVATGKGVPDAAGVQGSSATPVAVQAAVTTLVGSSTPQSPRTVKYNQTVKLKVPLTNNGNVTANGTAQLAALISTDGTTNPGSIVVASTLPNKSVNVKVNKTAQLQLQFKTPASSSVLAPGTYTLLIQLTKANVKNATNTTDGSTIAVIPFTIS